LTGCFVVFVAIAAAQQTADNPLTGGAGQREATKITDNIYEAFGFGNTFLITTSEGNVIVDTSGAVPVQQHLRLLREESSAPVRYIILTHGHGDHTGGSTTMARQRGSHPSESAHVHSARDRTAWALDYVQSLDKVLAWKPEIVLPSHGRAIASNQGDERGQGRLHADAGDTLAGQPHRGRELWKTDVVNPRDL
jgi:glyoxylase-like metal-dependent hydrolase (beta-lactamase superfamily II)